MHSQLKVTVGNSTESCMHVHTSKLGASEGECTVDLALISSR